VQGTLTGALWWQQVSGNAVSHPVTSAPALTLAQLAHSYTVDVNPSKAGLPTDSEDTISGNDGGRSSSNGTIPDKERTASSLPHASAPSGTADKVATGNSVGISPTRANITSTSPDAPLDVGAGEEHLPKDGISRTAPGALLSGGNGHVGTGSKMPTKGSPSSQGAGDTVVSGSASAPVGDPYAAKRQALQPSASLSQPVAGMVAPQIPTDGRVPSGLVPSPSSQQPRTASSSSPAPLPKGPASTQPLTPTSLSKNAPAGDASGSSIGDAPSHGHGKGNHASSGERGDPHSAPSSAGVHQGAAVGQGTARLGADSNSTAVADSGLASEVPAGGVSRAGPNQAGTASPKAESKTRVVVDARLPDHVTTGGSGTDDTAVVDAGLPDEKGTRSSGAAAPAAGPTAPASPPSMPIAGDTVHGSGEQVGRPASTVEAAPTANSAHIPAWLESAQLDMEGLELARMPLNSKAGIIVMLQGPGLHVGRTLTAGREYALVATVVQVREVTPGAVSRQWWVCSQPGCASRPVLHRASVYW
jgi:hypothetical protein